MNLDPQKQSELLAKYQKQQELAQTAPPPQTKQAMPQNDERIISPTAPIIPSTPIIPSATEQKPVSYKDEIMALEKELEFGRRATTSNVEVDARSYLDETGDETYYVENVSNGHVVISDLNIDTIPRNSVVDLLKFGDMEILKKSRDLRVALHGYGGKQLLHRLTPQEYYVKVKQMVENKRNSEALKERIAATAPQQPGQQGHVRQEEKIRPLILSKLEKFNLGTRPEYANVGLTPTEFADWALSENLSMIELDFIIGSITNSQVRASLLRKKAAMENA